jgi:hypothetical protein
MIAEWLLKDVVEVNRPTENIMSIKIIVGKQILTIYSVYAPQQGKDDIDKDKFWIKLEAEKCQDRCIIAGDLNGHEENSRTDLYQHMEVKAMVPEIRKEKEF